MVQQNSCKWSICAVRPCNVNRGQHVIRVAGGRAQVQLKGHRSVGGMRASIYNSMPMEGVQALVKFMADFQKKHS